MSYVCCPYKIDPDEADWRLKELGLITEDERIRRAYRRILADMMKRRTGSRP